MADNTATTTKADWTSDQEPRWCPGCGDYSVLTAMQLLMPELGVERENTVFVSGIGCAARFPYYMNTYGMHYDPRACSCGGYGPGGVSNPELDVWVIGGDGDMLSIGGNHLIHALRRNVNHQHFPVQQPDLRPHQGPVLADIRGGQGHEVQSHGFHRPNRSTR